LTALLLLLHLGGAVALLLWATRMVRTGVERAYGSILKARLRVTLRNPLSAVGFGGLMAVALQSSTAVVLLVSSFVGSGFVSAASGLMAVRGGELGSALLVKILVLDLNLLISLLLICGTAMFLATKRREWRQLGRISVGIALLLLSLDMTRAATAPLRDSEVLPVIINYLSSDILSSFLLAALLTYLFHSSIAGIILIASFAHHDLIGSPLALIMVLGVNFGSSLIAPLLTRHAPARQRIVPLGNLAMRGAGSLILLGALSFFTLPLDFLGDAPSDRVINAHIAFNFLVMLLGVIFAKPVLKITEKLVALSHTAHIEMSEQQYPFPPTALDRAKKISPAQALASARREIIRLSDIVDTQLEKSSEIYHSPSREAITEISDMVKLLDKRQGEFALYLAALSRENLNDEGRRQVEKLLDDNLKLQQVGQMVSRGILGSAKMLNQGKITLSIEDSAALASFFQRILANARLAFSLLVNDDVTIAEQLVIEKDNLRTVEQRLRHQHFSRLQTGQTLDMRASTLYLDLLNDLKQINAHLTSFAYPILEGEGLLKRTRLDTPA